MLIDLAGATVLASMAILPRTRHFMDV